MCMWLCDDLYPIQSNRFHQITFFDSFVSLYLSLFLLLFLVSVFTFFVVAFFNIQNAKCRYFSNNSKHKKLFQAPKKLCRSVAIRLIARSLYG